MYIKLSVLTLAVICLCAAATAQVDNCCFVDRHCNSDQDWVKGYHAYLSGQCAAPAQSGTSAQTGASSQIDNCCFAGWQCNTDQDWVNGYHAYQNGQCAAPAQTQPGTLTQTGASSQIDNCCFAGWQCNTDQDWVNGFHAYQNGQCSAPAQSQSGASTQTGASSKIDNCCFAGWQCNSEQDWIDGFHAFQNNQCTVSPASRAAADSCCAHGWNCTIESDWVLGKRVYADNGGQCVFPAVRTAIDGVIIEGSRAFVRGLRESFLLMKSRTPAWYAYVIKGPLKVREIFWAPISRGQAGTSYPVLGSINLDTNHKLYPVFTRARIIIHEACHVHRWRAGITYNSRIGHQTEEVICDLASQDMMDRANAPYRVRYLPAAVKRLIADGVTNIHELANAERLRAIHLLSTVS